MAKKAPKKQPPDSSTPRRPDRDRRVRQNARIARVLGVLNLIQSRGRWNAKAIASELECSERTVFRDLEVLEFAGVPWYFHETDQCYRVRPDYQFPVLALTEDEVIGQAIATALSTVSGIGENSGAKSTTRKMSAASSTKVQQILADASRLIEVFDLKLADHSKHQEALKAIQLALFQGSQITGMYRSPYAKKPVKLTFHPYRLCLIKQAWYVIGRIEGETDPKTIRVARFTSLRALDQPADIPDEFDLREYFGNAWSVYRGTPTYDIKLRFRGEAASIVTETQWHQTQQVTKRPGGEIDLTFQVDGLEEIVHWILGWSGRVKVLAPTELKVLVVQHLEDALQMNSEAASD